MKKVISLFRRNYDGNRLVIDEVTPGAEWVVAGEGWATMKIDGTCCLVRDGMLYKRYEVGKGRTPPLGFEPADEVDAVTGKQQGWVPVGDGPEDRWHREGWERTKTLYLGGVVPDGTFELIGPKIQGNPEKAETHVLERHGFRLCMANPPRTFNELKAWFRGKNTEGIVWHHADGRMVKIKKKDFGMGRGD